MKINRKSSIVQRQLIDRERHIRQENETNIWQKRREEKLNVECMNVIHAR